MVVKGLVRRWPVRVEAWKLSGGLWWRRSRVRVFRWWQQRVWRPWVLGSSLSRIQGYPQDGWRRRERRHSETRLTFKAGSVTLLSQGVFMPWVCTSRMTKPKLVYHYSSLTLECFLHTSLFMSLLCIIFWPWGLLIFFTFSCRLGECKTCFP